MSVIGRHSADEQVPEAYTNENTSLLASTSGEVPAGVHKMASTTSEYSAPHPPQQEGGDQHGSHLSSLDIVSPVTNTATTTPISRSKTTLSPHTGHTRPRRSSRIEAGDNDMHLPLPSASSEFPRRVSTDATPASAHRAMMAGPGDFLPRPPREKGVPNHEHLPEVVASTSPAFSILPNGTRFHAEDAPEHVYGGPAAAYYVDEKYNSQYHDDHSRRATRRTWMRRGLGILIVLILLGLALGLGLGLGLKKKASATKSSSDANNATTPLEMTNKGGIAAVSMQDGSNSTLLYYRTPHSGVFEQHLITSDQSAVPISGDSAVVNMTSGISDTGPMAATTFRWRNNQWKQFFFVDANGAIQWVNASGSGAWSNPVQVTASNYTGKVDTSAGALAVWGTGNSSFPHIRLLFADNNGVGDFRYDLSKANPRWRFTGYIKDADSRAGVGITVWEQENFMNVYFRYRPSGKVQQRYLKTLNTYDSAYNTYTGADNGPLIPVGASISATSNNNDSDTVFVQTADSHVQAIRVPQPASQDVTQMRYVGTAAAGTRLSSFYAAGGDDPVVVYQNVNASMQYAAVSPSGFLDVDRTLLEAGSGYSRPA